MLVSGSRIPALTHAAQVVDWHPLPGSASTAISGRLARLASSIRRQLCHSLFERRAVQGVVDPGPWRVSFNQSGVLEGKGSENTAIGCGKRYTSSQTQRSCIAKQLEDAQTRWIR